ncbi:ferritin-like domain-containing protein [Salinactinospora qingdaonensis]|uniref:Ferritin-like domain-containing protein n=1 Tax=Salinactinospora qingdaonensis TaxID=702744 RepID=A0ABP7GAG7_9ACTN
MSATPTPDSTATAESDDVATLQAALRAEHAAIYGYGYIGAHLSEDARERSRAYLDAHRDSRDRLRDELVALGAQPAATQSAYQLPDSDDEAGLSQYAALLEQTTGQAYLELAAATAPPLRDLAARALQTATVRALSWGAENVAFPGFPDGEPA